MLKVNFNQKIGSIRYTDGTEHPLFGCSCLASEFVEVGDSYQLFSFWNDPQHLKNCLGCTKDSMYGNLYENIERIRLNMYYEDYSVRTE